MGPAREVTCCLPQSHGAQMTDIVHFYLECAGLDYFFCFNPSGPHAVTLDEFI